MKKYLYFLFCLGCLMFSIQTFAQSPKMISYQAVMRDNAGALLQNQNLDATFIIHQGSTSNPVYTEQMSLTTNGFGLFTHPIGNGITSDDFSTLLWGTDDFYLEVQIDLGSGPVSLGVQQLLSVPYSLYAAKAAEVENLGPAGGDLSGNLPNPTVVKLQNQDIASTAPNNGEILKWDGSQWAPAPDNVASGGGSVNTTARLIGDGSIANPLDLAPQSASNNQVLKWNGSSWAPASDNVDDADADASNELQSLSLSGTQLSLSNGGGSVNLPTGTSYTSGAGITISGNIISNSAPDQIVSLTAGGATTISGSYPSFSISSTDNVDDADADATNELQNLVLNGTQLSLSNGGGTIALPNGHWNPVGQDIYFDNGAVSIGTNIAAPNANLHLRTNGSGNYDHLLIESPAGNVGFGLYFEDPTHGFYVGQNIGNWNDGRFQIAPANNNQWFTVLSNGNVGLTNATYNTPLARFQVPQNGNIDTAGTLDVTQSAIFIGETAISGIAIDHDQIESIGQDLGINALSPHNLLLVDGGGSVGIRAGTPQADLHVGEGRTVLFGADTMGKSNFFPDPKLMFLPGRGGAFRVGQLNADGSIIGGTGFDFWDYSNIGWASIAIGNNTRASGAGSVALGIRANADNFGAVALGHLSRTIGNSAISAGYYTRADAFVGVAVGAGNVGGGSANSWNATDPIFEVGNSIDTTNRSNAFTVLKNGRVGINHASPQSMLDIEQPNQGPGNGVLLNLAGVGHWETGIDNAADYNFYFNNTLKSYILDSDGSYITTSDRRLKRQIESLDPVLSRLLLLRPATYQYLDNKLDAPISIGFIAQEVEALFPDLVVEKADQKGLKYDGFSVIAIKAIQEQQAMIEQQQRQIELLEQRLTQLENR